MLEIIRALGALELALLVVESLFPATRAVLPIGKSHLAQIGVLFALLMIFIEFDALVKEYALPPPESAMQIARLEKAV